MDANARDSDKTIGDEISEAAESVQVNEVERRESLSLSLKLKTDRDENILYFRNSHLMQQTPEPDKQKEQDMNSGVQIQEKFDQLDLVENSDLKCDSSISKQIYDSDQKRSLLCDETAKSKVKDKQLETDKSQCKVEKSENKPLFVGVVNDRTDNDPLKECYIWNGETIPLNGKPVQKQVVLNENNELSTNLSVKETVKISRSKCRILLATKLNKSSEKTSFHSDSSSNTNNHDVTLSLDNALYKQPLEAEAKNVQTKTERKQQSIDQAVESFYKEINTLKTDTTAFSETEVSKYKTSCIKDIVDYDGDHEQSDKPCVLPISMDRIVDYDIEDEEDAQDNVYKATCLISQVDEHKLFNSEINTTNQANRNTETESESKLQSRISTDNNSLQRVLKQTMLTEVNGSSSLAALLNSVDEDFKLSASSVKTHDTLTEKYFNNLSDNILSFTNTNKLNCVESDNSEKSKTNTFETHKISTALHSDLLETATDVKQNNSVSETMDSYSADNAPSVIFKNDIDDHVNAACNLDSQEDQEIVRRTKTSQCLGSGAHNVLWIQEDTSLLSDPDSDCISTVLNTVQNNGIMSKIQMSSIAQLSSAYDESSNDTSLSLTHFEEEKNMNTCNFKDCLTALKGYANDDSSDSSCDDVFIKDKLGLKSSNNTEHLNMLCDASNSNPDFSCKPSKLVDASSEEIIDNHLKCKWIEEDINSPDRSDTESVYNTSCSSQGNLKVGSECDDLYHTFLKFHDNAISDESEKSWKSSPKSDHSERLGLSNTLASSVYDSPVSNISKLSLSKLEERKSKLTQTLMQNDSESPLRSTDVYSKSIHLKTEADLSQKLADIRYWIEQAEEESVATRDKILEKLQQGWYSECSDNEIYDMAKCKEKDFSESIIMPNFNQGQSKSESLKANKTIVQNDKMEPSPTEPYKEENEYRLKQTEHSTHSYHQRLQSRSVIPSSDTISKSNLKTEWNKCRERSGSNNFRSATSYRAHSKLRELGVFSRPVSKDTWFDAGSNRSRGDYCCTYPSSRESGHSSHHEQSRSRKSKSEHFRTNKHGQSPSNRSSTSRKRTKFSSRRKQSWSRNADERRIRKRESSGASDREHTAENRTTDRRNISRYQSSSTSTNSEFAKSKKTKRHRGRRTQCAASQSSRSEKVVILDSSALAFETLGM